MKTYKKRLTKKQREILNAYLAEYEATGLAPSKTELAKKLLTSKQNIHNILKKAIKNVQICPLCGQLINYEA